MLSRSEGLATFKATPRPTLRLADWWALDLARPSSTDLAFGAERTVLVFGLHLTQHHSS